MARSLDDAASKGVAGTGLGLGIAGTDHGCGHWQNQVVVY